LYLALNLIIETAIQGVNEQAQSCFLVAFGLLAFGLAQDAEEPQT
jgi:hypothetical protein